MYKIFITALYFSLVTGPFNVSFADDSKIQTLEEITAELEAKKDELEPFKDEDVKIDIESLGLDDLDKEDKKLEDSKAKEVVKGVKEQELPVIQNTKSEPKADKTEVKEEEISNKIPLKPIKKEESEPKKVIKESDDDKNSTSKEKPESKDEKKKDSSLNKVQKFLKKHSDKKDSKPLKKAEPKKKEKESNKKQEQTKLEKEDIESEELKKINEEKRKQRLEKLQKLREIYLIDLNSNKSNKYQRDQIIVPRKKEINPFIVDDLPALPILNRFRTRDNTHIPLIPTPRERIKILFDSISNGNVAFFNSAYENVKNPNAKNSQGDTIVTFATLLQKHAILASALTKGADPDMFNKLGYTPITIAIEMLDFESIELLANNGADISFTDKFNRNYLMHSARVGFLPAVEFFVTKGIDLNAMDVDGFTALSIAYRHKKEVIVKYLLQNGAKTWVEKPYKPEDQSLIRELQNRWKEQK